MLSSKVIDDFSCLIEVHGRHHNSTVWVVASHYVFNMDGVERSILEFKLCCSKHLIRGCFNNGISCLHVILTKLL